MRIRKGDLVQMISGKDRGKQGKVREAGPRGGGGIVENTNLVKEHRRPRPMKNPSRMGQAQVQPGGIFEIASAVPVSNAMLVCPACRRATRGGYELREAKDGGTKAPASKRAPWGG